jgi:uncharacterized membrane protein
MDGVSALTALTALTALGCAVSAGVLFAFSSFVMAGLGRLPDREGAAAMQSINVTAVRPVFMTVLFGTALLCVAEIVVAVRVWGEPRAVWLLLGAALYLAGVIGLTAGYHVPLNDRLAAMDPAAAAAYWPDYLRNWTRWNHLRALSGVAAAAALIYALVRPPR